MLLFYTTTEVYTKFGMVSKFLLFKIYYLITFKNYLLIVRYHYNDMTALYLIEII